MDVITNILDIESNNLSGPVWSLALILADTRSDSLLAHFEYTVGIHFAESLCIMSQSCLVHVNFENALHERY